MLENLKKDLPFLNGKYHKTTEPFNAFARMAYHGWDCDETTGLDDAAMREALGAYVSSLTDTEHAVIKAKAFAFVLDNMRFTVDEHDYFPCLYNWSRPLNGCTINRWNHVVLPTEIEKRKNEYAASGDITCWIDYDHSVPDWEALYQLGFVGIRRRAAEARQAFLASHGELTAKQDAYFDAIDIEYAAILRLIVRIRDYAENCTFEKAPEIVKCLSQLAEGAPTTLYERLMLIYLYFMLSESVDSYQVRSLGSGIDHDVDAPYQNDLENGIPAEKLDEFIGYFLVQFSAIGNYWGQPMYLGGSNLDGSTRVCDASYKILSIYDELGLYNPKIQVKYSRTTPRAFLEKICDMIRRGHSSFVLVCNDNVVASYLERGVPRKRCYDFDVKGCYEYALRGGEFSTAPFYVNLLGPVVRILKDAKGDESYETLLDRYFAIVSDIFETGIAVCNGWEKNLAEINPAPMLSATIRSSIDTAQDAYYNGAELDTTAFVVGGIASAVDALMVIKAFVYDEKRITLKEFIKVLAENWSDVELRRAAKLNPHKFGCGDSEADALAAKIADKVASYQGIPNVRGGYFKVTMHSARQFIEQGRKMPATPDGRLAGEETSKNASPVQGHDRAGVTALIRSALATKPSQFTEGYGFDVMLHESATRGEEGLTAMLGLLYAYDLGGGSSIQFNVCSSSTLRDAQVHPEKYENMQIRVCGWNVLWNNMPKSEQDKYIERAENIS